MGTRSGSIRLFQVYGIRVGADLSWFVILFLAIFWLSTMFKEDLPGRETTAYLTAVATALLLFGSLLAHELGHAVMARRAGMGVASIDLWMLGGITRMDREAESPGEELRVTLAGPAMSLLAAVASIMAAAMFATSPDAIRALEQRLLPPHPTPGFLCFLYVALFNLVIVLFNMIPAWPLDGGRIARAIAWKVTGSRTRGTIISARLGRGFSWILAGYGILEIVSGSLFGAFWLLLAFMIGQSAKGALLETQMRSAIGDLKVMDLMDRHPVTIPAEISVVRAEEEWFRRYGWSWFPVVDATGRFVGLAREEEVRPAAELPGIGAPPSVADVMESDAVGVWSVSETEDLEQLLAHPALAANGALMAVDDAGILQGVITVEQVRAALSNRQSKRDRSE